MERRKKLDRRKRNKNNKVIVKSLIAVISIIIVVLIGIGTLGNKKSNSSDKESLIQNDGTSITENSNSDKYNANNDVDEESINLTTSKQEIIYTSHENDAFADNAKDVENMLDSWNYLREDGKKIAYLTFDDGPSAKVTPEVLRILKENDIKATFFLLGSNVEKSDEAKETLKQMVKDGHAIGNHGYSHDYSILYPGRIVDTNAFMNDMQRSEDIMKSVLGDRFSTNVIRFPGGHMSWNTKELDPVLEANGYSYIDWNALNGDAEANNRSIEQLISRLKGSVSDLAGNDDVLVVLMHDTDAKETTAQSLQSTIDYLKSLGYEFRSLK